MAGGNGSNRNGAGSNNRTSGGRANSTNTQNGSGGRTNTNSGSSGGRSATPNAAPRSQNIRFTGGVTRVTPGINYSPADMAREYSQYRSPPSSAQNRTTVVNQTPPPGVRVLAATNGPLPSRSGMDSALGLRQYVNANTGPANPMARAMTGPSVSMGPGSNYRFGDLAMGQMRQPKQITASLGDDMASGIESRVAARVSSPGPLRGVSTQGRPSMVSPMAGQGSPYPGATSPVAGKAGFPAYQARLQATLMDNYKRGQAPSVQMAGTPSPTSAPPKMSTPQRASLIGDDPNSFMSPNTLGKGAGGLIGTIVGGPVGGLLGSKLGGYAVDKAREYGHPLYGSGGYSNNSQAQFSGIGSGGSTGTHASDYPSGPVIDPITGQPVVSPKTKQGLPDTAAASSSAFLPKKSLYPEYYSQWAGLPRGLFG